MGISISIIVLSSNNQHITLVLDRLFQMVRDGDEIILVDDHSQDDYVNYFEGLSKKGRFQLIASSRRGNRAHNRNLGAKEAKNEILLFLDGDIILCDNGLEILRQAHRSKAAVAFVGPKHAIHYSDIHVELYSALTHEEFISMLKTPEGREAIYQNPLFRDYREDFFCDTKHSPYFWLYYYTGASSVEKNVFNQIGGFDENFATWGSEDVDLGYRISKHGSIGYLPQFHAIHIPHPRDILSIESTNAANILRMYAKYRTWEFEVVYSFSATADVFNSMLCIIQQMQLIELTRIKVKPCNNSLIIETVSRSNLSGCVQYIDERGAVNTYNSLGLVLLFPKHHIKTVYVSDNVFVYPPLLTSRILQEALRVGQQVFIVKSSDTIRIDWINKTSFPSYHSNPRLSYKSDDLMDFTFKPCGEYFQLKSEIIDHKNDFDIIF